jgi:hypothetical protein
MLLVAKLSVLAGLVALPLSWVAYQDQTRVYQDHQASIPEMAKPGEHDAHSTALLTICPNGCSFVSLLSLAH